MNHPLCVCGHIRASHTDRDCLEYVDVRQQCLCIRYMPDYKDPNWWLNRAKGQIYASALVGLCPTDIAK